MKVTFWFLFIATIALSVSICAEINKKTIPKKAIFLSIIPLLFTIGSGYLFYLQHESEQNMKAIEAYFESNCGGYVMKPMEDPIEVEACGDKYLVRAKNGEIDLLEKLSNLNR